MWELNKNIFEKKLISSLLFMTVLSALLPSGFTWINYDESISSVEGTVGFKIQWGLIIGISFLIVLKNRYYVLSRIIYSTTGLLLICIYCGLSAIWSPVESATLKKTVQFFGLILFSYAIQCDARPWNYHVKIILAALTCIEISSFFVAIFIPSIGIDDYFGYAWRGIVAGKNGLGAIAALSTLLWLALGNKEYVNKKLYWAGILLSLLCVVMSKSSTGILMTLMGCVIFFILNKKYIGSPLGLQRIVIAISMFVLTLLHWHFIQEGEFPDRTDIVTPIAQIFGKTSDLTGRSDIWEPLMIEIQKHWLLGVGYGAFWLGPGSPSQPILDSLTWIPLQGHNGYLDLLNELGIVGCIIFTGWVIYYVRDLFRLGRIDRQASALYGSILAVLLFSNLTESSIFRGVNFSFLLMILSGVSVTTTLIQYQQLERLPPKEIPEIPRTYSP